MVWLAAAGLAAGGLAMSLAVFARQAPIDQTFSVGTISLGVVPTGTLLTFAGMVPGNEVEGVLTIQNDGTGDLRYSMTAAATDPDSNHLRDMLQLEVDAGRAAAVRSWRCCTAVRSRPPPSAIRGREATLEIASLTAAPRGPLFPATFPSGPTASFRARRPPRRCTFRAEQVSGNP